jgi:hypothetical protein
VVGLKNKGETGVVDAVAAVVADVVIDTRRTRWRLKVKTSGRNEQRWMMNDEGKDW